MVKAQLFILVEPVTNVLLSFTSMSSCPMWADPPKCGDVASPNLCQLKSWYLQVNFQFLICISDGVILLVRFVPGSVLSNPQWCVLLTH